MISVEWGHGGVVLSVMKEVLTVGNYTQIMRICLEFGGNFIVGILFALFGMRNNS